MEPIEGIAALMAGAGVDQWGVCRYADVLPLLDVRSKRRIPPAAKSILVLLFGYYIEDYPNRNISRYAIVDDYHTVLREKLDALVENLWKRFKTEVFIPFVDASPVAEVRAARLAGLGDVGLNGQLLNPVYGSYCFIAEVVTTLELPPFAGEPPRLCTRCEACRAACPTGALSAAGFDRARCRSHITQKKGELTPWEREQVRQGGFVWGCDRCTDACPMNRGAAKSAVPAFYQDNVSTVGEANVESLCRTKAYGWRGAEVLRRNLRLIRGADLEKTECTKSDKE